MDNIKLIIFDIDGTLTEIKPEVLARKPDLVTPNRLGEQQPKVGVVACLLGLAAAGMKMALATNRGGVAWGYTSLEDAYALAREAAALCAIPEAPIYLCPNHPKARGPKSRVAYAIESDCRKPNPGMLLQAMREAQVDPNETLFVGDMESDQQAAQAAGMGFCWAEEFFK